jgi:hypothetical protein
VGLLSRRRAVTWPTVEGYAPGGTRGDIKSLSVSDLERLQAAAAVNPWSAVGRPAWVREHRDRIRQMMLNVVAVELPSVYRCLVTIILDDESGGRFTLDVAFDEFNGLPDVTLKTLVELAHRYLLSYPYLELDPDQQS